MNTFLVLAAGMAVAAAMLVALPLLRDKQSRILGGLVLIVVMGAAAGLYPLWSNWNWHAPPAGARPDVAGMVAKLEGRLRGQPNDVNGWLLLGRSYLTLERPDDAVVAYGHARGLDAKNVDAAIGLGEAMSLRAGGEITTPAAQMFEAALVLAPTNPKALLYGGFAAAVRGDHALARTRWEALKALHPPPQIVAMLDARIAELPGAETPAVGKNIAPAGSGVSVGDSGAPRVIVNISVAPALEPRLKPGVPMFVFAREPGGRGLPLAAKRLTAAAIGTQVQLSPADSMVPGRVLVSGSRVSITARVSFSGQPLPATGDLYGELSYDVGRDGPRNLVIDRVAQ
ncbi:MAG: hypothetical protein M3N50_00335 [Pseudomonadota bacterium]|nr:hypothetical protein [Pseudomonadota bacterium]